MDYRPTRYQVAKVYSKRVLRWKRNSSPYVSGDAFADLADVVFNPPHYRGKAPSLKELKEASVIFVRSHDLHSFLETYSGMLSAKVIIAGNSDFEFRKHDLNIPKSTRLLLMQNSFLSGDSRIRTLPIGIENFRFGVNGHPKLFTPETKKPLHKVLIGPYSKTHIIRNAVISEFECTAGPWTVVNDRKTPKELALISNRHLFIAAVRGNGVDTHRLWETLYRGRYPICIGDSWLTTLRELNLPILEANAWEPDLIANLVTSHTAQGFNSAKLEALWMPYWEKLIANQLF